MWPWDITADEAGAAWATAYLTFLAIVFSTGVAILVPYMERRRRRDEMLAAGAYLMSQAVVMSQVLYNLVADDQFFVAVQENLAPLERRIDEMNIDVLPHPVLMAMTQAVQAQLRRTIRHLRSRPPQEQAEDELFRIVTQAYPAFIGFRDLSSLARQHWKVSIPDVEDFVNEHKLKRMRQQHKIADADASAP